MSTVLHPALGLLLRMQVKARWRKMTRGTETVRGKLRLAAILLVLALGLSPMILGAIFSDPVSDPSRARSMVASGLFVLTLFTLIGQGPDAGISFTPAEVDFLFPAPFRRRDLLVYRLAGLSLGAFVSALFFSVVAITYAPHWLFAFLGFALAIQFIQLIAMILGLAISIVGQSAYTRGRKAALIGIGLLLLLATFQAGSYAQADGVTDWVRRFSATPGGAIMLAPAHVFASAITAERLFPDFVNWTVLAVTVNAAMVVVVLRLDADFLERSVATSQKVYLKLQRLRAGQGWMNLAKPSGLQWRLPMPARWRGAGPIAWRQLIGALRGSRGIVYFILIVAVLIGFAVGSMPELSLIEMAYVVLPMMAVTFLPQMLRFDFRADFENFDMLKTLPVSPTAIAVGELIAPTAFATLLELPFLLAIGISGGDLKMTLTLVAFLPVINLLIFALENLIFLWYPQRLSNAAEFSGMGRRMLTTMAKVFAVMVVAATAFAAGIAVYWILGAAWAPALVTAWLVVTTCALLVIPLVARAFDRLDMSSIALD